MCNLHGTRDCYLFLVILVAASISTIIAIFLCHFTRNGLADGDDVRGEKKHEISLTFGCQSNVKEE